MNFLRRIWQALRTDWKNLREDAEFEKGVEWARKLRNKGYSNVAISVALANVDLDCAYYNQFKAGAEAFLNNKRGSK